MRAYLVYHMASVKLALDDVIRHRSVHSVVHLVRLVTLDIVRCRRLFVLVAVLLLFVMPTVQLTSIVVARTGVMLITVAVLVWETI